MVNQLFHVLDLSPIKTHLINLQQIETEKKIIVVYNSNFTYIKSSSYYQLLISLIQVHLVDALHWIESRWEEEIDSKFNTLIKYFKRYSEIE